MDSRQFSAQKTISPPTPPPIIGSTETTIKFEYFERLYLRIDRLRRQWALCRINLRQIRHNSDTYSRQLCLLCRRRATCARRARPKWHVRIVWAAEPCSFSLNFGQIVNTSYFSLVTLGTTGIAISGLTLMITNFQVCNYFTTYRGVVLNLLNGCIDSSSTTALILYLLYGAVGYKWTWFIYVFVGGFVLFQAVNQFR